MEAPLDLKYISDDTPGFSRKKWGRGFIYFNQFQEKIKIKEHIDRIKSLVIPPMWQDVWICPSNNGYLQVTGKDEKNRKQYLYHSNWTAYRQAQKFQAIERFGEKLPKLRNQYKTDLKHERWDKAKVIALTVCLLDNYYFRIGNSYYAKKNETYGLTTLCRRHLHVNTDILHLAYKAKSGKMRNIKIDNPKIARLLKETSELPGYEIFRYKDNQGHFHSIDSSDVNDYLHKYMGQKFSAKNFRTWGATKTALELYPETIEALNENVRLKFEPTLMKKVAKVMGNTVTVCRKYYVHPDVQKILSNHYPKPIEALSTITDFDDNLDENEARLLSIFNNSNQ